MNNSDKVLNIKFIMCVNKTFSCTQDFAFQEFALQNVDGLLFTLLLCLVEEKNHR